MISISRSLKALLFTCVVSSAPAWGLSVVAAPAVTTTGNGAPAADAAIAAGPSAGASTPAGAAAGDAVQTQGTPVAPVAAAPVAEAAPDGGPPISLSEPAVEAASAFRAYEKHAAAISPAFKSGAAVEDSLAVGAAYEPKELARGAVAYAALVALQDPTFVAAVRIYAKDPEQRRDVSARIEGNPYYAGAFPGADSAAGLIVATLASETARLQSDGAAVKQSAYDVQHSAWSKSKVIDPAGRLARTKALSAAIMQSIPEDVTLLKASEGEGLSPAAVHALGIHGQPVSGPYAPVVRRGLAVAALTILGEGGDDNDAAVETLMTEPEDGACLNMAKLNLYQCLAVAGPWYEDIFCLGEHAMKETASCLTKETGTAEQIQAAVTPGAQPSPGLAPAPGAAAATVPVAANVSSAALASPH